MLLDLVLTFFLVGLVLVFLKYLHSRLLSRGNLPDTIPWVGCDGGPLSRAKATLQSVLNSRQLLEEGYYKVSHLRMPRFLLDRVMMLTISFQFSKNNQAFVLPNLLTGPE